MNLLHIDAFLAIVEYNSITKAADKLFISQSTLSNRLDSLESEVGDILIERHRGQRFISLTAKGEEFLLIAKKWKSLSHETQHWMNGETSQVLRVGSVDSLNIYVFAGMLRSFKKSNPWISVNLSTHWSTTIHNFLDSHHIDIGLVPQSIRNNNIVSEPIFSENMVMISNSLLSNYPDMVNPGELISDNEVYFDWGPNYIIYHDSLWNPLENPAIIVDTPGLILQFMNEKDRWAIVTESVAYDLKKTFPLKISHLSMEPPKRICYKLVHRAPIASTLKSIAIFDNALNDFITQNPYLTHISND